MHTINYKMEYSILEYVFGLIGPAIIIAAIFYPIADLKIGTLRLHLPTGVANGVLMLIGAYATYLTVGTLFKKRAANSQGASIVLDEKGMSFTTVKKFSGVLTTVGYDAINQVTITDIPETSTSSAEKTVEISTPSMAPKKHEFDAIHMVKDSDFEVLVNALKHRAINATFKQI
ncbi:hypothetical protein BKP43_24070 [Variovorax boronicumulans]|uniref:hypothetical protein n=1 Tax=Variovorax boronicumulans TaxID=436515 RepID=UPI000BB2F1F6|nr:hypothetical protein [Variovorax boronicumulans]PBI91350.1 hypothetical protein BKP43_24070 [Variovorax boronicumulans]